jgi:hypothetical protein
MIGLVQRRFHMVGSPGAEFKLTDAGESPTTRPKQMSTALRGFGRLG